MRNAIIFFDQEEYQNKTPQVKEESKNNSNIKMDFYSLVNNPIKIPMEPVGTDLTVNGKKRGRPRKDTKILSDGTEIVLANESDTELSMLQTNVPYDETYNETNSMLKSAIFQADVMTNEIKNDLNEIRLSKTLKRKYDYISLLSGTSSTLLSTKVNAIRELNNIITNCHNLELKRFKDLKLSENAVDDDKRIMDMYNAFISTPIGTSSAPSNFMIPSADLTVGMPMVRSSVGEDAGYVNYISNLSPEQNAMRYENDPNVKTVVVYDKGTSRRWFDVINIQTGESIPNISRPDSMFLEDTTLDLKNNIARNPNLNATYPLIVQGNSTMLEY